MPDNDALGARVSALPDDALHKAILAVIGGANYLIQEDAWRQERESLSLTVYAALGRWQDPQSPVHLLRRRGRGTGAPLTAHRRRGASS